MTLSRSTYEALSFESYVTLDFETTGLDPEKDEIIEVGMVRVKNGEISEHYHQLFKPSIPIPHSITQLTGIRSEDCKDSPPLNEKFFDIIHFIEDQHIVIHNAPFDLAFLNRAYFRYTGEKNQSFENRVIDTLALSRLFLYMLPNHRLETVADYFQVSSKPIHRAHEDAETTALIFKEFLLLGLALEPCRIRNILKILGGVPDGLRLFFSEIIKFIEQYGNKKSILFKPGPNNILGKKSSQVIKKEFQKIEDTEVKDFFKEDGVLSTVLTHFEYRRPQFDMARLVAKAINTNAFLVAEASTGVGKSLAYLVPALLWVSLNKDARIIITTHTKNLQDQLFNKEIPFLLRIMNSQILAVLLKGRSNYICLQRWNHLLDHLGERLTFSQRRRLLPLTCWIADTKTGDIDENSGFRKEHNTDIWSQLNSEHGRCTGYQCDYAQKCFLQKIRKTSQIANIVVVNHSLLFSDMASANSILGDYNSLIIDEAHHLEHVSSQFLGSVLHVKPFRDVAQRLYQTKPKETGVLVVFQNAIQKVKKHAKEKHRLKQSIESIKERLFYFMDAADQLFHTIDQTLFSSVSTQSRFEKKRVRDYESLFGPISEKVKAVRTTLSSLTSQLSDLVKNLESIQTDFPDEPIDMQNELSSVLDNLACLESTLLHFFEVDYQQNVVWCERKKRANIDGLILYSVPIHVGGLLAEGFYTKLKRCILTSATLAIGNRFDYILSRWGMDQIEPDRVMSYIFDSPFDYADQVHLLIPSFLASPKDPAFSEDVSRLMERILTTSAKGTLILFTSYEMLRNVYRHLRLSLEPKGIRIMAQGIDGSRSMLLRLFQKDVTSVLLGTNSFWEGIDVPGSSLELLAITKMPFNVPTDPLFESRMEWIEHHQGNSFMNYAVPEAIIRFRQGFGRLIRSGADRGVVLLMDHRILKTQYGSLFLESLPVKAIPCHDEAALLQAYKNWF